MQVEFFIAHERKRICAWSARIGRHTVPGTVMASGNGLPHDLSQYVIESAAGYGLGFWGLLAKGATYKSTKQRVTKLGRAVIVRHRPEINAFKWPNPNGAVGLLTLGHRHLTHSLPAAER